LTSHVAAMDVENVVYLDNTRRRQYTKSWDWERICLPFQRENGGVCLNGGFILIKILRENSAIFILPSPCSVMSLRLYALLFLCCYFCLSVQREDNYKWRVHSQIIEREFFYFWTSLPMLCNVTTFCMPCCFCVVLLFACSARG
jgi:hypothetical protein